jgi:hypothetical protein
MIQKGKPIPTDLIPIEDWVYENFLNQVFNSQSLNSARHKISSILPEWNYLDNHSKVKYLDSFHETFFTKFFPKPVCKLTFSRVRFAATFHANDWCMQFSENALSHNFEPIFAVWLHESYHAFLHFLSLRLLTEDSTEILNPPQAVIQIATKYPLAKNDLVPVTFAKRNLIGMLDRSLGQNSGGKYIAARIGNETINHSNANPMTGIGWDSYYLNVEIIVENLTEASMKKILPQYRYKRSYVNSQEYIKRRLNGIAPAYANH